jgi:uncharacterized protein (DUF2147 family)
MRDTLNCPDCGQVSPQLASLYDYADWMAAHAPMCPERFHRHHRSFRYVTVVLSYHSAEMPEWQSHSMRIPRTRKQVHFHMADLSVRDSDPAATAAVTLTDAAGAATTPDATPTWAEDSNGTVLTLAPSADGMSATLTWVAPGTANISFNATDNDGTTVIATGSVEVTPGEAKTAEMTFTAGAAPAPAPAPPPS